MEWMMMIMRLMTSVTSLDSFVLAVIESSLSSVVSDCFVWWE